MSERHSHPHFNDQGTLHWHTSWGEALAAASEGGKKLFIEFGRELWGQCRSLVEALVPRPDIGPVLQEGFVALAADCDDPEEEVVELAKKIEDAQMLPFVIVADSEGNYLGGASGMQTPEGLRALLGADDWAQNPEQEIERETLAR